ncbi:MAG: S41 family peptidase [Bacilli bacterium]
MKKENKEKDNNTEKDNLRQKKVPSKSKIKTDVENHSKKDKIALKNNDSNDIKTSISFNLIEVIIIILITGIIVSIISGVIVYNNYDRLDLNNKYSDTISKSELSKFEENYNKIINKYVEDVDRDELIEAAIKGMYNYLGDDYSMYIDKDDSSTLEESLRGQYTGIGIEISSMYTTDGNISVITKVFDDTPAQKAGLKVGDLLVSLNGVDLSDKDATYVANTIKYGDKDTHILKVIRDEKEIEVELSRTLVNINYVHSEVLDNNIGYIKIDSFGATTTDQVKLALDKFDKNITSLIVDLRDNSGGYLSTADEISNIFIEKGKNIYQIKDREGKITVYKATNEIYRKFDKISVLINENSASASEILALALKESAGAKIVGTKSFGKGSVQETEILDSGAMVKYTVAYWLSANGNSINEVGITPDIIEEDVDKQIIKAKEVVK